MTEDLSDDYLMMQGITEDFFGGLSEDIRDYRGLFGRLWEMSENSGRSQMKI